jgi:hypothetical protein
MVVALDLAMVFATAHVTELATLMAMAFPINCNCVCRMAPVLVCSTVIVTDQATVHVMELATLMAMAFPIR